VNIVLWVLQGVLAAVFLAAGAMKLTQPKAKLASSMAWVEDFPAATVKAIGGLEAFAAFGLVLPAASGIATVLTPLAAAGLVLLMVGAAVTHTRRKEPQVIGVNVILLLLALVVSWGRFGPYS
jgi:uncharacterized membrane protein YphA (DoxX/SURF4 family)